MWSTPRSSPTVWSTSRSSRAVRSTLPIEPRRAANIRIEPRSVVNIPIEPRSVVNIPIEPRGVLDLPIEPRGAVNLPIEPRGVSTSRSAARCARHPDRAAQCGQPFGRGESPHHRRSARSAPRKETSPCHPGCRGGTDGLAARLARSSRAVPSIGRARRTILRRARTAPLHIDILLSAITCFHVSRVARRLNSPRLGVRSIW